MLGAFGRADALAYPPTWSTPSSSCSCAVHLKARTPTAVRLQEAACSQRHFQNCSCLHQPFATPRRHRFGHLRTHKPSQPQRFDLRCRAAVTSAEQQQFVFRSATSAEDLQQASVLRADAYYEVPEHFVYHVSCARSFASAALAQSMLHQSIGMMTTCFFGTGATSCALC